MKKINRLDLLIYIYVFNAILFISLNIYIAFRIAKTETKTVYIYETKYANYTDTVINFIKQSEGVVYTPTNCPAGKLTIGYGHVILNNEKYKTITEIEAEALLKYDFQKCYRQTYSELNHNQKLAMAHFIFSVGYSRYKKIETIIMNGGYIGNDLIKYVYYTNKGNKIKSTNAIKNRLFEIELFYKQIK